MAEHLLRTGALLAVSFGFGWALRLGDMLEGEGYRWFRGAGLATAGACAALGVAMVLLGHAPIHVLWLAVLASWLVRRRIDRLSHLLVAGTLAAAILLFGTRLDVMREPLFYFVIVLVPLGVAHDLAQRGTLRLPAPAAWLLARPHTYWYAMAVGYCALFEIDPLLCLCIYGFVGGYLHLEPEARRERLRGLGIRRFGQVESARSRL